MPHTDLYILMDGCVSKMYFILTDNNVIPIVWFLHSSAQQEIIVYETILELKN